jgi:hypothetical protein
MATNIFLEKQNSESKPRRGPKVRIDDNEQLWRDRNDLVGHLENNWHDVGGRLASIKKPSDVVDVFTLLAKNNPPYVIQVILRPTSKTANGALVQKMRTLVGDLNAIRMSAWAHIEKCRGAFEAAENVGKRALSDDDRILVEEAKAKRANELAKAAKELALAERKQDEAQKLLEAGETYFARKEVIDFCRSRRYMLTPINTANALAGLPWIGWRRSIALCQNEKPLGANGGRIQVFNSIQRIVRSCVRRSQLAEHAELWLRRDTVVASEAYGVSELRNDWSYFRRAIKNVLEAKVRSRDLHFTVAQEYWKRKENASPVERLLAEDDRVIV